VELLRKYKSVWVFLLRFFVVYLIGLIGYNVFLNQYSIQLDGITRMVTEQVASMLSVSLPEISCTYSDISPLAQIRYTGITIVLLVEGCNAVSIMILFLAFLGAFKGRKRDVLWFAPLGLLIIYFANLVRIYLISMIILYYPNWTNMAHDYVFPGVIYGTTFILWVIWVKYFSIKEKDA
jgi:exosortase family protein XrtF